MKVEPERAGLDPTHTRDVYYGYDIGNRPLYARFDSHSGEGIASSYDSLGRLAGTSQTMDGVTRSLDYTLDAGGRRTQLKWPNWTYTSYTYDAAGRMQAMNEGQSGSTAVLWSYSYSDYGRRVRRTSRYGRWLEAQADGAGRLTSLTTEFAGTANDNFTAFTYNNASQIGSRSIANDLYVWAAPGDVDRAYAVNGLNQYTAVEQAAVSYDANGNLTGDPGAASGGATAFVYDVENRLVSAAGAHNAQLRYDPLGRLYEVAAGGAITRFLYDGDELVAEYNAAGTQLRRYAHGAGVDDPVVWWEGFDASDPRWMMADHQGSIVAGHDALGNVVMNRYDTWGMPGPNHLGRFGYTGQAWIPELGLYHYKARMYSPRLGRFMQTDPIGYDDQINLYAYVRNDPLNLIDPTGQRPGDPFLTPAEAAVDWLNEYNPRSIRRNREYLGVVYERNGRYYSTAGIIRGATGGSGTIRYPRDARPVEDVHSHGDYAKEQRGTIVRATRSTDQFDSDNFSGPDYREASRTGRPITIGTPSGVYKRYDPATGETQIIEPYEPEVAPPPMRPRVGQPLRSLTPRGGSSCDGRRAGSCGTDLEVWN